MCKPPTRLVIPRRSKCLAWDRWVWEWCIVFWRPKPGTATLEPWNLLCCKAGSFSPFEHGSIFGISAIHSGAVAELYESETNFKVRMTSQHHCFTTFHIQCEKKYGSAAATNLGCFSLEEASGDGYGGILCFSTNMSWSSSFLKFDIFLQRLLSGGATLWRWSSEKRFCDKKMMDFHRMDRMANPSTACEGDFLCGFMKYNYCVSI